MLLDVRLFDEGSINVAQVPRNRRQREGRNPRRTHRKEFQRQANNLIELERGVNRDALWKFRQKTLRLERIVKATVHPLEEGRQECVQASEAPVFTRTVVVLLLIRERRHVTGATKRGAVGRPLRIDESMEQVTPPREGQGLRAVNVLTARVSHVPTRHGVTCRVGEVEVDAAHCPFGVDQSTDAHFHHMIDRNVEVGGIRPGK